MELLGDSMLVGSMTIDGGVGVVERCLSGDSESGWCRLEERRASLREEDWPTNPLTRFRSRPAYEFGPEVRSGDVMGS